MDKFIDLSHDIDETSPVYPGDEIIDIKEIKDFNHDGYTMYDIKTSMHTGTHVDAPMHLSSDKRYINSFDLNRFYGKASIINASDKAMIDWNEEDEQRINEAILVVYTGFDKYYGKSAYYTKHPVLTEKFARKIIEKKIKLLVLDIPSPDYFPYDIHKILFEHDICIVENAKNLHHLLNKEFIFHGFPLKIKAEASLIRAVAMIL